MKKITVPFLTVLVISSFFFMLIASDDDVEEKTLCECIQWGKDLKKKEIEAMQGKTKELNFETKATASIQP